VVDFARVGGILSEYPYPLELTGRRRKPGKEVMKAKGHQQQGQEGEGGGIALKLRGAVAEEVAV